MQRDRIGKGMNAVLLKLDDSEKRFSRFLLLYDEPLKFGNSPLNGHHQRLASKSSFQSILLFAFSCAATSA